MAQSVEYLTLDFGSGHDLVVHEIKPRVARSAQNLLGVFSLSLCSSPAHVLSVCLSVCLSISLSNKKRKNRTSETCSKI